MSKVPMPGIPDLNDAWMRDAACTRNWGLPWTDSGRIPPLLAELMEATCHTCPVFAECERFVQEAQVTAGWWAGASRNDRELGDYQPAGRRRPPARPDAA